MSIYFNQTNLTPGTSQFITRAEVGLAVSTIAGDLSGLNISSLLYNPSPSFSSILMNATGSISGGASVSATQTLGLSSIALRYSRPYSSYAFTPGLTDQLNNFQPFTQSLSVVKPSANAGQFATVIAPTAYQYVNTSGVATPVMTLNQGSMSAALSNISSINGQNPTTAGTTFTNLTGSNLTTTGTLTSPQIVSVSSINGLAFGLPLVAPWTGGGSRTVTGNGVPALIASISLPAGYLTSGTTYLVDVPLVIGALPPSPTNFTLFLGLRLGSSGLINYQVPYFINTSAGSVTIQITSVLQTNSGSVGTNTIDILAVQSSGAPITLPLQAPGSGANLYCIKPL